MRQSGRSSSSGESSSSVGQRIRRTSFSRSCFFRKRSSLSSSDMPSAFFNRFSRLGVSFEEFSSTLYTVDSLTTKDYRDNILLTTSCKVINRKERHSYQNYFQVQVDPYPR